MAVASRLLKSSPGFVKNLFYRIVPFRRRYGLEFSNTIDFLLKSIEWDREAMLSYQLEELKRTLVNAYNNTTYYHKLFVDYGLNPYTLNSFDDINKLPILTKEIVNRNYNEMIAHNFHGRKILFKTSGSTGAKFQFMGSDSMYKREAAFVLRAFLLNNGSLYDEPTVWVRRYAPEKGDPISKEDKELNRIYISPFDLSDRTIELYVRIIDNSRARVIVTYPSLANFMATLMRDRGLIFKKVQYIHCASEMVLPEWRENVLRSIGIPLKAHYGMMEKVSFYCNTHESDRYLENLEYGYTEIIDGEVVGTGFMNQVMPLIRYSPGDRAIPNSDINFYKALPYSVNDFIGRSTDMISTKDGRKLAGVNFYTMMYKIEGVEMFQIIQSSLNDFVIKIVPNSLYSNSTIEEIRKGFIDRVGECNVEVYSVLNLDRADSGKFKTIINEHQFS